MASGGLLLGGVFSVTCKVKSGVHRLRKHSAMTQEILRCYARIFSSLAVPGLCDTIGRYVYLFNRLTAVLALRFYRFEHIVSYSSGKVIAK